MVDKNPETQADTASGGPADPPDEGSESRDSEKPRPSGDGKTR